MGSEVVITTAEKNLGFMIDNRKLQLSSSQESDQVLENKEQEVSIILLLCKLIFLQLIHWMEFWSLHLLKDRLLLGKVERRERMTKETEYLCSLIEICRPERGMGRLKDCVYESKAPWNATSGSQVQSNCKEPVLHETITNLIMSLSGNAALQRCTSSDHYIDKCTWSHLLR